MVDVHSSDARKRNMRAIKGKNTKPELIVRKGLFRQGFRYRIAPSSLPGKPDIVFPKYQAVIFVNGCYWHGHGCYLFKIPQSRKDFWVNKISSTIERDEKKIRELRTLGYRVLSVWECAVRGKRRLEQAYLIRKVSDWILSENEISYIDETGINSVREADGHFSGCCGKIPDCG